MSGAAGQASLAAPASLRALLAGLIDYAGLYPPAGLDMATAVAEYARQRRGPDGWVLGRFVVSAARLDEFGSARPSHGGGSDDRWPVSVLLGGNPSADLEKITAWEARGRLVVEGLEFKARDAGEVDAVLALIGTGRPGYVEVPLTPDPTSLLTHLGRLGLRAKARTGGLTQDLFPALADVVRFFEVCSRLQVPFKLTAGLHHPLQGDYRLTYRPDSAQGRMFGFLTMFAAAAAVRQHWPVNQVASLIAEMQAGEIRFDDAAMHWNSRALSTEALAESRVRGAISFGSCSFEEPLTDLRGIGYLPA
ncbi:MAG: hypothetical protein ABJC74_09145 [Gemmatimonadota bacterium]